MIETIIGVIYLAFMLGKKEGKWGCFTAICIFFLVASSIASIKY